jgi:transposase
MRPLVTFLRRVLQLQALVVLGGEAEPNGDSAVIKVRRRKNAKPRCPVHRCVLGGEITTKPHRWRHLDFGRCPVYLEADLREGRCSRCDGRRTEGVPWTSYRAKHTKAFDRWVARLVQLTDKTAVAELTRVSWTAVGNIVERVVAEAGLGDPLDNLIGVTVDEVSHKRGHRYITVVTNLETGDVVWTGEGKSAETLGKFFDDLGPERSARLQVVAIDMSAAYASAVRERAPNADIVYDRFHVVKLVVDAVDAVRRSECAQLEGDARKDLKNTRFALLRNPKHLRPRDEAAIQRVQASNRRLTRAYQLRVDFEQFWEITDEEQGRRFLMRWTRAALCSRLEPFRKLARTIRAHIDGILGFIRWGGITSGQAEGMNNKIKMLIHRSFGFHSAAAVLAMVTLCCSGISL